LIVKAMVDLPSAVKLVASDLKVIVLTTIGVVTSLSTGFSVIGWFGISGKAVKEPGATYADTQRNPKGYLLFGVRLRR